jgi:carbamoyl-phosphate synthase small subunit
MTTHSSQFLPSRLLLENGLAFEGFSPKEQQGVFFGEVVFTTGMTGYPESLTDPSYRGQILTFTYPLMGNYGIPSPDFWESKQIHVRGIVINLETTHWSHYTGLQSLSNLLKAQNIPLITGVDTRELTKILRVEGTCIGCITSEKVKPHAFFNPNSDDLVAQVSPKEVSCYGKSPKTIIAVDCGMKENIIRSLLKFPLTIKRVPYNYDYTEESYDGIFISNGPGDPACCTSTVSILKKALEKNKPIFGICLGIQLLALAAGAKTYKLTFGHRGQNQPCIDQGTKKCYITSQNHGYAVDESSLPDDWKVTFRNINDGSVEGIAHRVKPFFAVQFHPEASPGPTDALWLFEKFYELL